MASILVSANFRTAIKHRICIAVAAESTSYKIRKLLNYPWLPK